MRPCPVCGSREPHEHSLVGRGEPVHVSYGFRPETQGMSEPVMIAVRAGEIAWFRQHPTEGHYFRRIVKGEAPPDVTAEWVKVTKLDPEANERTREFYDRIGGKFAEWKAPKR